VYLKTLQILNQMANQGGNRGGATQSVSLYNLYKNRSYTCNIDMLGNALIQPTMYFNLRNVPMFSGSYYITSVSHNITDSSFETSFEGVRQPVPNLPKIDNYIQNLRANLVSKITELIKQQSTTSTNVNTSTPTNVDNVTNNVTSNAGNGASQQVSQTTNETCKPVEQYNKFVNDTSPTEVTINYQDLINEIKNQSNDDKLLYTIFFWSYTNSFNGKDGLRVIGNNPGYLSLDQYFGTIGNEKYFCTSKNIPFVEFSSLSNYVDFLIKRWQSRVITLQSNSEQINVDEYVKFAYINSFADSVGRGTESYNKMVGTNSFQKYKDDFNKAIQILKPATNVVTQNTPPPAPPISIKNLGEFPSVMGNTYAYFNIEQSNGQFEVLLINDPNFNSNYVGSTQFKDVGGNIVPYSCSAGSGAQTCIVNSKNPGNYTLNVEYFPNGPLNSSTKINLVSQPFTQ